MTASVSICVNMAVWEEWEANKHLAMAEQPDSEAEEKQTFEIKNTDMDANELLV